VGEISLFDTGCFLAKIKARPSPSLIKTERITMNKAELVEKVANQ